MLEQSITYKWIKHLNLFIQAGQPWDDPKRFYNFSTTEYSEASVFDKIRSLLMTVHNYDPKIITKDIKSPLNQDDLNYLHHIFEKYHGLYDEQNLNEFFQEAPKPVQDALGDLNIWIHRYESIGGFPRFVATWKYKPYRDKFDYADMELFTLSEEWGDLRLNYCEIGKSLYDFWHDNDSYIDKEAFKPHHHFCFDCTVRFTDKTKQEFQVEEEKIWNYFDANYKFFKSLGYEKYDKRLCMGGITIGKLIYNQPRQEILREISKHQTMKSIRLQIQ